MSLSWMGVQSQILEKVTYMLARRAELPKKGLNNIVTVQETSMVVSMPVLLNNTESDFVLT